MNPDLLYQLSLTMVPNIGTVQAKILLQHCEAEEIFHAKKSFLEKQSMPESEQSFVRRQI